MRKRNPIPARREPRRRGWFCAGNPLWPLEELRNLSSPPFPDPEFTPLSVERLNGDSYVACAQVRSEKASPFRVVQREFPIPHLVRGLPWRYVDHRRGPIVPEVEYAPLDFSSVEKPSR
jgi:hypothetical protein